MNASLRIENGQFYRGNELVKPEFGNREQIKLIQETQKQMELEEIVESEGIEVNVECKQTDERTTYYYRFDARFICICGQPILDSGIDHAEIEDDEDKEDYELIEDCIEDFMGGDAQCKSCQRKYQLLLDDNVIKAVEKI